MRVISGIARGHNLKVLKGSSARPTTDRVKESLFNIIQPFLDGARFLDLFAGTGSIGIEALSRGAKFCLFIEKDERAIRVIRENLAATGLAGLGSVKRTDAFSFAARAEKDAEAQFDIVFADPPYSKGLAGRILKAVYASGIMHRDALLIIEHRIDEELPDTADALCRNEALESHMLESGILRDGMPRDGMLCGSEERNASSLVRRDLSHYGDTLLSFYRYIP